MLHMDLFGPSKIMSFGRNYYALVVVDEYFHYAWTIFLSHKKDMFVAFQKLTQVIRNEKVLNIASIRSDHGSQFQNVDFENYFNDNRIEHTFSTPRTPQQKGVIE